jgi:hypothetical protein
MGNRIFSSMGCAVLLIGMVATVSFSQNSLALKNRTTPPKSADIDQSATIAGLLSKSGPNDWSDKKAAVLDGYVLQVEKDPDGDVVMFLAANAGETSTTKWVIVEVPPAWQKQATLSEKSLRGLVQKHVKVTGWLFYDATDNADPRGTRWEIHPVTSVAVLD